MSIEYGRAKLISGSKSLDDGLLTGLTGEELENVRYHLKECYKEIHFKSRARKKRHRKKRETKV